MNTPPCAFQHIDQLFDLMKTCHVEHPGDLYLYSHIFPALYFFYCKQALNAKEKVSKYSCAAKDWMDNSF